MHSTKQIIFQTATKANYISDIVGSYLKMLKVLRLKFGTLSGRTVLPYLRVLASVKPTRRERKNWHR